jgi:prophage DNA circulation protein
MPQKSRSFQVQEVTDLTIQIVLWLRGAAAPGTSQGRTGSDLRRATGDLAANVGAMLDAQTYSANLSNCFNLARLNGGTYSSFDLVRTNIIGQAPLGELGIAVQEMSLHFCLIQQARINAGTNFQSRDDVDKMLQRIDKAWTPIIDYLANYGDAASYQTAIALFTNTANDLTSRSRPLPRMMSYSLTEPVPTLRLANMLYPDSTNPLSNKSVAQRSDELVAENHIVHPAFPPVRGRCLADQFP